MADPRDRQPESDVPWFAPDHQKSTLRRRGRPGELLFRFHVEQTHTFWRVELRDHGTNGIEAQLLDPVELRWAHTFRPDMDPTRTPREMAVAWALRSQLVHVSPSDPPAIASAVAIFGACGLLGSMLPALRAARIGVATALRDE